MTFLAIMAGLLFIVALMGAIDARRSVSLEREARTVGVDPRLIGRLSASRGRLVLISTHAAMMATLILAFAVLPGCSLTQVDQTTGPTTVTVQPPPTPTPAPPSTTVPPAPSHAAVAVVEVHFFGKSKNTPGKDLKVGEVGDVTASPFDAQGNDVGQPTDPVSWSCTGGVTFVQSLSNHYNGTATGKTTGAYTCAATAGGVTGTLAGNVIP